MSLRNGGARAFPPSAGLVMLGLLLLTGCGGSGSSGFEAVGEAAAITRALSQGSCVIFDDTSYCGSEAPLALDGDTASVRINGATTPRRCRPQPAVGCPSSVPFVPEGFPDATFFRAASAATAEGPWTLLPTIPESLQGNNRQVIQVPAPAAQSSLVAALAYIGSVPDDLPSEATHLADFQADAVYLQEPFEDPSAP